MQFVFNYTGSVILFPSYMLIIILCHNIVVIMFTCLDHLTCHFLILSVHITVTHPPTPTHTSNEQPVCGSNHIVGQMENGGREGQDVVKLAAKNDLRRPNLRKRRGEKVNVIGCSHNLLAADIEKSDWPVVRHIIICC